MSDKIKEVDYIATIQRPDGDSDRLAKKNFIPRQRGDNFPFDRPTGLLGQPNMNPDRGTGGHSVGHAAVILPHDLSHSAWNDIEEILGSPILLSKAYSSQLGSIIPGVGNWANDPPKDWDKGELEEDFDPKAPPVERPLDPLSFLDMLDQQVDLVKPNRTAGVVSPMKKNMDIFPDNSAWGELIHMIWGKDFERLGKKSETD